MSVGIILSDTIVSTVEIGVAVYNEILGDPANDPAIENNRKDMKRARRKVPQTIVRRVATALPIKAESRIKIPISRFQEEYGISVSNNGKYSVSPFEDTSWLYEEEGNIQSSFRTHKWTPNPYPKDFIQRWELRPPTKPRSRFASGADDQDLDSGLDSISVTTKTTEASEERVAALEKELGDLKAMMASFALTQMAPVAASTPAPKTPPTNTLHRTPAPPAPPPPPPAMQSFKPSVPAAKKPNNQAGNANSGGLDMNSLLKDVGKQKSMLKSVEKSPGGTPLRRQPRPCNPQDPSTILANALKQKFANSPTELDRSSELEASFNDSATH